MSSTAATPAHLREPRLLLALGFGSGLAPRAPGTAGTLIGVGIYLCMLALSLWSQLAVTVAVALVGIPLCGHAARRLAVHDDPAIVWDEIAGFLVAMTGLPGQAGWIVAAFVLFRLFDATKPLAIGWLDRHLAGGFGIMADDVLAGAAACIVLHAVRTTTVG